MVFYFTGTGNSLYAAKQLDAGAVSIPRIMNCENLVIEAEEIGIVCPVYGHEIPAMVKEFIRKATFNTNYLYVILTYGARHANAVELADKVLKNAGKQASYITTLLMVDNFLPVFDMNEQIRIDKKVEEQLAHIQADICAKKRELQNVTLQDKEVHQMYLDSVNGASEKVWADFEVMDDCIGCGICTKVCPAGCIHLENQTAIQIGENCQACFACIHACPKMAIKMRLPEKNPKARYRNEHITLSAIVAANNQCEN